MKNTRLPAALRPLDGAQIAKRILPINAFRPFPKLAVRFARDYPPPALTSPPRFRNLVLSPPSTARVSNVFKRFPKNVLSFRFPLLQLRPPRIPGLPEIYADYPNTVPDLYAYFPAAFPAGRPPAGNFEPCAGALDRELAARPTQPGSRAYTAYEHLRDPVSRAAYLLAVRKVDLGDVDFEFTKPQTQADSLKTLREALAKSPDVKLAMKSATSKYEASIRTLAATFRRDDLTNAVVEIEQLIRMRKLMEDIKKVDEASMCE